MTSEFNKILIKLSSRFGLARCMVTAIFRMTLRLPNFNPYVRHSHS